MEGQPTMHLSVLDNIGQRWIRPAAGYPKHYTTWQTLNQRQTRTLHLHTLEDFHQQTDYSPPDCQLFHLLLRTWQPNGRAMDCTGTSTNKQHLHFNGYHCMVLLDFNTIPETLQTTSANQVYNDKGRWYTDDVTRSLACIWTQTPPREHQNCLAIK